MVEERSDDMVATMQSSSSELPNNEDVLVDQSPPLDRQQGTPPQVLTSPSQVSSPVDKIASLLQFASTGKVDAVRKLLEEGVDVDSADYDWRTALHLAASEGHFGVVELLLERKAKVNPVDRWNDTPLQDAMRHVKGNETKQNEYQRVYELLAAHGGQATNKVEHEQELAQLEQLEQLQDEYEIDRDELNLVNPKIIGQGSYGQVFLVKWRGTNVAAKMILQKLAQKEEIKKEFRMELLLLQSLRHPNIVEFLGAVTKTNPLVIVTEYLPNGDLHEIIQRRGRIPARDAVLYALDIARGMNYLHQHKPKAIVHRDLKPRNLLQDAAGSLKVADFGLSKLLEPIPRRERGEMYHMTGGTGTYRYMAPEVYLHHKYDKSVDVFSFGIIVQEMFEGTQALLSSPGHEVAQARAQADARPVFFARTYPPEMKELLRKCWDKNPALRPTFEQIIGKLETMRDALKAAPRWRPKPMMNSAVSNITTTWSRWVQNRPSNDGGHSHRGGRNRGGGSHRPSDNRSASTWNPSEVSSGVGDSAPPYDSSSVSVSGDMPPSKPSSSTSMTSPEPIKGSASITSPECGMVPRLSQTGAEADN